MITFIKGFKRIFPEKIQVWILIGLSLLAIVLRVWGDIRVFDFIESFLPVFFIVLGVLILQKRKESLIAHFLLFFLVYADKFGGFIRAILSYNFGTKSFTTSVTLDLLLGAIGSAYLIMLITSYLLESKLNLKYKKSEMIFPIVIVVIYVYFRYSFTTAVIWVFPAMTALFVGAPLAAILLLTCNFIAVPFSVLDQIITSGVKFISVSYWIFSIAALLILFIILRMTIKMIKSPTE